LQNAPGTFSISGTPSENREGSREGVSAGSSHCTFRLRIFQSGYVGVRIVGRHGRCDDLEIGPPA
jgi:hypothetical protein